jgi:hypothetical protein
MCHHDDNCPLTLGYPAKPTMEPVNCIHGLGSEPNGHKRCSGPIGHNGTLPDPCKVYSALTFLARENGLNELRDSGVLYVKRGEEIKESLAVCCYRALERRHRLRPW